MKWATQTGRCTWLFGLFFLAASCAPVQSSNPPPPPNQQSCTPGVRFCDENVAKVCGEDGRVAERLPCEPTQTCFGGFCDDNKICEPDTFYCVLNVLKRCNSEGTELSDEQDCGDMACVNGACVPVAGVCPANAYICVGNAAAVCNPSGDGYAYGPADCGADATCIDGACQPVICEAGQSSCVDGDALTCNVWGTGYSHRETCEGATVCVAGRCQLLVCAPGVHCQDNVVVTCSEDGTAVIDTETCGGGEICVEGACTIAPTDAGLPDNARPDGARADTLLADLARPDTSASDAARPDAAMPDSARPDTLQPDTLQPPSCSSDDSYEPNDHIGEARSIANDGQVANLVACDEYDWFSTVVPDDRSLSVELLFSHAQVDIDLYIYEAGNSSAVAQSTSSTDNENAEYTGLADNVLIEVRNYTWPDQQGGYQLNLTLGEPPVCGDGRVSGAEECDTNIASGEVGACPTSCSDSYCSHRNLVNAGTCQARCASTPITQCLNGDECCPATCSALNDDYCPSGWVPCGSDSECPADRYCDLSRATPVCKQGCRIGDPSACPDTHHCASDHRCVLSNVIPHQRCAPCDDNNPCDTGFGCTYLINICAPTCNILLDECPDIVGPSEICLLTVCSMSDCP